MEHVDVDLDTIVKKFIQQAYLQVYLQGPTQGWTFLMDPLGLFLNMSKDT